jgi:hypothetical protein
MVRAVVYLRIVWIAITGAMMRGVLPYPDGLASDLLLMAAFLLFPFCIAVATYGAAISIRMKFGVVLVEVCLTLAYFIAVLPGVQ